MFQPSMILYARENGVNDRSRIYRPQARAIVWGQYSGLSPMFCWYISMLHGSELIAAEAGYVDIRLLERPLRRLEDKAGVRTHLQHVALGERVKNVEPTVFNVVHHVGAKLPVSERAHRVDSV